MSETDTGYVYTLSDPRSGDPKYVGATINPNQRYHAHLDNPHSEKLAAWVDELATEGLTPTMSIVQIDDVDGLATAERRVLTRIAEEHEVLNDNMNPSYTGVERRDTNAIEVNPDRLAERVSETTAARGLDVYAVKDCGLSAAEWAKMTGRDPSTVARNVRRAHRD